MAWVMPRCACRMTRNPTARTAVTSAIFQTKPFMGILSPPIETPLPDPVLLAQKREFRPGTDSRDRQIGKDEFDKGVPRGRGGRLLPKGRTVPCEPSLVKKKTREGSVPPRIFWVTESTNRYVRAFLTALNLAFAFVPTA